MQVKTSIGFVGLAMLAVGSFWLLKTVESELEVSEAPMPTQPMVTAYGVFAQYYTPTHQLQYQLTSDEVIEYSNRYGTAFVSPRVLIYQPQTAPPSVSPTSSPTSPPAVSPASLSHSPVLAWQASAAKASLSGDKNTLQLQDNALIIRMPGTEDEITIKGQDMRYDADNERISSERPVVIRHRLGVKHADEFNVDLAQETLDFAGNVSAQYQPASGEPR